MAKPDNGNKSLYKWLLPIGDKAGAVLIRAVCATNTKCKTKYKLTKIYIGR
jgi:hypothetical protein